jgi:hypothetical protein
MMVAEACLPSAQVEQELRTKILLAENLQHL